MASTCMVAPSKCDLVGTGKEPEEEDSPNMASSNILSFEQGRSLKRSSTFSADFAEAMERAGDGFIPLGGGTKGEDCTGHGLVAYGASDALEEASDVSKPILAKLAAV